jgi:hypothetical protein
MLAKLEGELVPDRWLGENAACFPMGKNPWEDIYTEERISEIAKVIDIVDTEETYDLRLFLSGTAEYLRKFFSWSGSLKPHGELRKWNKGVDGAISRLLAKLSHSDDFLTGSVWPGKTESSRTISPPSELAKLIAETEQAAGKLQQWLRNTSDYSSNDFDKYRTTRALYLQEAAYGVTEVFIFFKGIGNVKRTVAGKNVDGVFPEFARSAAIPFLETCLPDRPGKTKLPEDLNAQIQKAVKKYNPKQE